MSGKDLKIRVATPDDFDATMELVRAVYGHRAVSPARWRHQHHDPSHRFGVTFVAVDGDRVVGVRPMVMYDYTLLRQERLGALFTAVMVHPEYRRMGLFRRMVDACTQEAFRRGADFVSTMPNELSYKGFMRVGWTDPGKRTLLVRPLDLKSALRTRVPGSFLGDALGMLPQAVLWALTPRAPEADLEVEEIDNFGPEFDDFASRMASSYPGLLLRRGQRWLAWRYRQQPWGQYRRYVARDGANVVRGLAVTNRESRAGFEAGYLVELLGETSRARRLLAARAAEGLGQDGAQFVMAVMTDPAVIRDLIRQAYVPVPSRLSPKDFNTVYLPNPERRGRCAGMDKIAGWYQTLGDWDGI